MSSIIQSYFFLFFYTITHIRTLTIMDAFFRYLVKNLPLIILLAPLTSLAEDEYALMMEAEAKSSQLDKGVKSVIDNKQRKQQIGIVDKKWRGDCDYAGDVLLSGIPRDEFSSYLKQCSFSLFVFYRKLDAGSQSLVFDEYRKVSPVKFSSLKESIVKYL